MFMKLPWSRFGLFLSLLAAGIASLARAADEGVPRSGIDPSGFDTAVRPQDDFFRYINGGWIARTQIPADRSSYGSFFALRDKSESNLRAILEKATADGDLSAGSEARKIGDFYTAFMDLAHADALGIKPIEADLARVDQVADKTGLVRSVASLEREGVTGLFGAMATSDAKNSDRYIVYLNQGGISLPDEAYYRDAKFKPIRDAFVAHVARMFAIAGVPEPKAAADRVMAVETALARHHWDRVKSRDRTATYNKLGRKQLDALTPGFDWAAWLKEFACPPIDEVVVRQPDYFKAMATLLDQIPLYDWKTWLKWQVLHHAASFLSKPFVDEDFAFFSKTLTGTPEIRPRWKRGVEAVEKGMGEAAGKIYVARHFPPEAKARMKELVANLIAAYREDITTLDWMSPETRKRALEKLDKFNPKIGYPDKWRDYSGLEIRRDDLLGNVQRADGLRGRPPARPSSASRSTVTSGE